jgi:hypothetical protein
MRMYVKVKRAPYRGRKLTGKLDVEGFEGKSICFCKKPDEEIKLAGLYPSEELNFLINEANWIAARNVLVNLMTISFYKNNRTLSVASTLEKRLRNISDDDDSYYNTHHVNGNIFDNLPQNRILIPIGVHRKFHDNTIGINNYDEFIDVINAIGCHELVERYQNPDRKILFVSKSEKPYEEQEAEIWREIGLTITERNDLVEFLELKIKEMGTSSYIFEFEFEF